MSAKNQTPKRELYPSIIDQTVDASKVLPKDRQSESIGETLKRIAQNPNNSYEVSTDDGE